MKTLNFNIRRLSAGALCLLALTNCNKKLDQSPETALSDANFWKTPADLKLAANYFYTFLPGNTIMTTDNWTADAYATGPNTTSDGSRLAPATDATWNDTYRVIRACNNLIEKSSGTQGDEKSINAFRGEARFFRAWNYFELVKRYGDVPLILRTIKLEDSLINASRSPREVVIDSIYKDLDWAIANLEQIDAQAAADYGRVTITAAQALKAEVGLFEGTRQKFHNYGTPAKHLQIAVDASKAVIDGGKHALYKFNKVTVPDSSYYNLFQMAADGKTNKEAILVRLYGADLTNRISVHNIARSLEQGGTTPTRNLVDAYLYKDGLPFNKSVHDSTTPAKQIRTLSQFSNRDLRMGQTIFNRTSFFLTGNYNPTYLFSPSGYKTMKYFNQVDWQNQAGFADFQIIRYAEVLLTYAEALYELNGAITDADLDKSINLTRARAGLPKLTNAFATANALDMREEIRRERRVELAFEGNRYWDIMRWKTAEIELPVDIVGAKHIQAEYGNLPANTSLTADGFVIVQKAANRKFDPARDYLFPLPTQQLALQPALTQNDNWR
jgi:hypothetical protein